MNIKVLWNFIKGIITTPKKFWEGLQFKSENKDGFLKEIFYPTIGIYSVSIFLSALFGAETLNVQRVLKHILVECMTFIGGLFTVSYTLRYVGASFSNPFGSLSKILVFVGSCYVPMLMGLTIFSFLPKFHLERLLWGLVIYNVWNACISYFEDKRVEKVIVFILLSALLVVVPVMIEWVVLNIMPNMKY
ncbi:MAG TPA: hypothetical protein DDY68_02950 [Porphyromonadaceae bacterium]|nr:hypothetical protein [Porphyromonadaceae bacterium]